MKNANNYILVEDVSPWLTDVLKEQLDNIIGVEIVYKEDDGKKPCVVVTSPENHKNYIVPKLVVNLENKIKLGDILLKIHQMIKQPFLYVEAIPLGTIEFQPQDKLLKNEKGVEVSLTDREVDILYYLAQNSDTTVSKDKILKDVWNYQQELDTHTLETHIYRLRQKLEEVGSPDLLITQENGYILNAKK